jgi:hypothetical protein
MFGLYATCFALSFGLFKTCRALFGPLVVAGIVFRLLFIAALPNLSQDFYRFIWDGRLILEGISPYLFTPRTLIDNQMVMGDMQRLYDGMGALSAGHYSNYPPVNQLFFALAAWLGGNGILGPVIVTRLVLILADIGILVVGGKLLQQLGLRKEAILLYFLNPFIIIELCGNLHFEGLMLFFLMISLYLLYQKRWIVAAVFFGLSISIKLIPLLFVPIFYRFFVKKGLFGSGFWRLKKFFWIAIGTVLISFVPFYSQELIGHYSQTIGLWFNSFEFNASVFYVVRWIGYQVNGWDPIGTAGKILPLVVLLVVLLIAFIRKNNSLASLITSMLFAVTVYLLLSTTVHPWYLATPLLLSVFTPWRYMLVWTLTVILSYSAYRNPQFEENLWLIAAEYLLVLGWLVWELSQIRRQRPPLRP